MKDGSMIAFVVCMIFILIYFYNRYFPIFRIQNIHWKDIDTNNTELVDVRDYQNSFNDPVKGAVNIPIAYLKRNYREINNGNVLVIAANVIEKNIGIRFLKQKGYRVVGYSILDPQKAVLFNLEEHNVTCE